MIQENEVADVLVPPISMDNNFAYFASKMDSIRGAIQMHEPNEEGNVSDVFNTGKACAKIIEYHLQQAELKEYHLEVIASRLKKDCGDVIELAAAKALAGRIRSLLDSIPGFSNESISRSISELSQCEIDAQALEKNHKRLLKKLPDGKIKDALLRESEQAVKEVRATNIKFAQAYLNSCKQQTAELLDQVTEAVFLTGSLKQGDANGTLSAAEKQVVAGMLGLIADVRTALTEAGKTADEAIAMFGNALPGKEKS